MAGRTSTRLDRVKRLDELEAENSRLRRTAADLTAYLRALRNALSGGTPVPRRPAVIDRLDSSGRDRI
jgi:hypothetical protein